MCKNLLASRRPLNLVSVLAEHACVIDCDNKTGSDSILDFIDFISI